MARQRDSMGRFISGGGKGEFSKKIDSFANKAIAKCINVRRTVVIQIFNAIILDTPVLEGRLRGNWQTRTKSPILSTTERKDPSGSLATSEATNQILGAGPEEDIHMTNNLPYARRIEYDGYSSKAPQGMMRRNVARFARLIRQEAMKARNQK